MNDRVAGFDTQAVVVEQGAQIDPAAWDRLATSGQAPLRHGFIAAWQHVELASLRSRPLVARRGDETVGATHAYVYDLDVAGAHSTLAADAVQLGRRLFPRLLMLRSFELGSPTPLVNPFLARPDGGAEPVVEALVRAGLDQASALRADLMIVHNFEAFSTPEPARRVLTRHGFQEVPIPPTVIVELPFATFEDYLAAMRAHYRRRARKIFRLSAHLEPEDLRTFATEADELARLCRLVFDRATEMKRELPTAEFFAALSELDYVHVLVLRRPDRSIASYALLIDDSPWLHFLYTGFERQAGEQEGAYFRLLYEIIRCAIENGFPSVNLGITTTEPKLDVGGTVLPLSAWIRHRHTRLQPLVVRLGRGPFAPPPVPPRTVFKT